MSSTSKLSNATIMRNFKILILYKGDLCSFPLPPTHYRYALLVKYIHVHDCRKIKWHCKCMSEDACYAIPKVKVSPVHNLTIQGVVTTIWVACTTICDGNQGENKQLIV